MSAAMRLVGNQVRWRLASPRRREKCPEIRDRYGIQSHQHRGKSFVVRLGEKLRRVGGQQAIPLGEIADAHRDHVEVRQARLLRRDALHPHPDERLELSFVGNGKCEPAAHLLGGGQRQRNSADVLLSRHWQLLDAGDHRVRILVQVLT